MLKNFIFIGRSGCGKGTQAELLTDYLKRETGISVFYVENGQKFRDFLERKDNPTSQISQKIYKEGGLQPEFLSVYMWTDQLIEKFDNKTHLVIDGAPRRLPEASILDSAFRFYGRENLYVLHIDIGRAEAEERLLARGRSDDKSREDISKRLDWFDTDVVPVLDFFKNNSRYKFLKIDGERSIEDIHKDIIQQIFSK